MLGAITTVAVIALAHAVARPPASKDEGWRLNARAPIVYLGDRTATDQPIVNRNTVGSATSSPSYASATQAIDRLDWLKSELLRYKSLQAGWDGEDSEPAHSTHIDAAIAILRLLPAGIPLPKPMLSSDGEVGLYWKNNNFLADAVIEDEKHFSLFIRSLKSGNKEVFIPSIAIGPDAPDAIGVAFQAA